MFTQIYNEAFMDELEKISEEKPSKLKKGLRIGTAVAAGASSIALAASALRKRPGLIKKVYGKRLKPILFRFGHELPKKNKMSNLEEFSRRPFKIRHTEDYGRKLRLKKNEIGLFDNLEYDKLKVKDKYITPPGQKSLVQADDKLIYGKKLYQQGTGAKTWRLSNQDIAKVKKMRSDAAAINFLNKKYGKGKYIFKPRKDSLGLPSTIGKESLVHSGTKSKMTGLLRKNPGKFIGQEKLNIKNEYRVRTLNGKVIGVLPRYASKTTTTIGKKLGIYKNPQGEIGVIPLSTKFGTGRRIKKFVKKNPQSFNLGDKGKRINTLAFDVAEVKGKKPSYKVIETNINSGGDMDNPYIAGRLYKKLTGKASGTEKAIKLTGSAGLAGVSGYAAYPYVSDKFKKKVS